MWRYCYVSALILPDYALGRQITYERAAAMRDGRSSPYPNPTTKLPDGPHIT